MAAVAERGRIRFEGQMCRFCRLVGDCAGLFIARFEDSCSSLGSFGIHTVFLIWPAPPIFRSLVLVQCAVYAHMNR